MWYVPAMLRSSLRSIGRRVGQRLDDMARRMTDEAEHALARTQDDQELAKVEDDLPVVARMVIEIRSDGSRTVARGAMEDVQHGERVAIRAAGSTPARLAASLARSIVGMPLLARAAFKSIGQAAPPAAGKPRGPGEEK